MLDMGFIDEVGEILDKLPQERLSILVSATLEAEILQIAHKYVKSPKIIEIGQKEVAETVIEEYVETTDREKFSHLVDVLRNHSKIKILIFRETKLGSDRLQQRLWERGFKAGVLQGDMSQAKRNSVLAAFKAGQISILVATNVAARGLHIEDSGLWSTTTRRRPRRYHLHRVGRTGRMSTEGKAITFVQRPESREERMNAEHPDFAWMKQGGTDSYRSDNGRDRRGPPPRGRFPSHIRPRQSGPNEYGSGLPQRGERRPDRSAHEGGYPHPREGHPPTNERGPRPQVQEGHPPTNERGPRPQGQAVQHPPRQEQPQTIGQHFERSRNAPSHRYMPHEADAPREEPQPREGGQGYSDRGRRRRRFKPHSDYSR